MLAKEKLYCFTVCALIVSLAVFLLFPEESQILGRDYFLFLDGAYRVSQGLMPHFDFPSQLGYLNFHGLALFLHFSPDISDRDPIVSYIVLTGMLTLVLSFVLIDSKYWRSVSFLLLLITVASIGMSLLRVGDIGWPTIHGFYRRFCVAMIVVISYFCGIHDPSGDSKKRQFVIALVLALLGYLLLFTKITHFLAALIILLGGYANKRIDNRELVLSVICFSVMLAITELFMPGILLAYFNDLLLSASISERSSGWLEHLGNVVESSPLLSFILLGSAVAAMSFSRADRKTYLVALLTTLMAYIFVTKYDGGPVNLDGTLGLIPLFIYFANINKSAASMAGVETTRLSVKKIAMLVLISISVLPVAIRTAVSYGVSLQYFIGEMPNSSFKAELAGGTFYTDRENAGYLEKLADISTQMHALQPASKLFVFDLASAPNYAYKLPPTLNSHLWIHPGLNVSKETHPDINDVIGDAGFVLVPKVPLWPFATDFLSETYAGQLSREFCVVLNDQHWVLYKRLGLGGDVLLCSIK